MAHSMPLAHENTPLIAEMSEHHQSYQQLPAGIFASPHTREMWYFRAFRPVRAAIIASFLIIAVVFIATMQSSSSQSNVSTTPISTNMTSSLDPLLQSNSSSLNSSSPNKVIMEQVLQQQLEDLIPEYIEEFTSDGGRPREPSEPHSQDEDNLAFASILALEDKSEGQQRRRRRHHPRRRHRHHAPAKTSTFVTMLDQEDANETTATAASNHEDPHHVFSDEDSTVQLHRIHQHDVTLIHNAMKKYERNPFVLDYHAMIETVGTQFPHLSGDMHATDDDHYRTNNPRYHAHLAHSISTLDDMDLFHSLLFFHISDTHIDAFFNPYQSSIQSVCSSCHLNSKVYGDETYCPLEVPFTPNAFAARNGYNFGRLRCNPPPALLASMLAFIRSHEREPSFLLITGDIGAHGMPTDKLDSFDSLNDFCPTKFIGMRNTLKMFKELFPHTPIIFTPGNNDHLPKNTVYRPYFEAFASLLLEFDMLHPSQALTFSRIGSHYVDLEVDNVAYTQFLNQLSQNITVLQQAHNSKQSHSSPHQDSANFKHLMQLNASDILREVHHLPPTLRIRIVLPDMTLLAAGGEPLVDLSTLPDDILSNFDTMSPLEREDVQFPLRGELIRWVESVLVSAHHDQRIVLIAGHQPMSTKKGNNELALQSAHGIKLKTLLRQYSEIIRGGFFGHRNLASINNILGPDGSQIIPSLVIPGVSPRGNNLPAIHEVSLSRRSGVVLNFEQYVFNLIEENEKAQRIALGLPLIDDAQIAIQPTPSAIISSTSSQDSGASVLQSIMTSASSQELTTPQDAASTSTTTAATATPAVVTEASLPTNVLIQPSDDASLDQVVRESLLDAELSSLPSNLPPKESNEQLSDYFRATNESIPYLHVHCHNDPELCQFVHKWGYLGTWTKNAPDISTWRKMTGYNEFTAATVADMNNRVPRSAKLFSALEVFKHAALIGDETPENLWCKSMYDDENMMMSCLFPEQDPKCWSKSWLK